MGKLRAATNEQIPTSACGYTTIGRCACNYDSKQIRTPVITQYATWVNVVNEGAGICHHYGLHMARSPIMPPV